MNILLTLKTRKRIIRFNNGRKNSLPLSKINGFQYFRETKEEMKETNKKFMKKLEDERNGDVEYQLNIHRRKKHLDMNN